MKKMTAILLLLCMALAMLTSCAGTTPDVAASENLITDLKDVNWTLPIQGGSAESYTLSDAQKHDITKWITSMKVSTGDVDAGIIQSSVIMEGILLKELAADMGATGKNADVTYVNLNKETKTYTISTEDIENGNVLIGWILNKKQPLRDTETYVGIYFNDSYKGEAESVHWLTNIKFN